MTHRVVKEAATLGLAAAALLLARSDAATSPGWRTQVVSSIQQVRSDLIVPPDVCLKFDDGGGYDVSEGATVTVRGPLEAPLARIFYGSGRVILEHGSVDRVHPEWWGARPDDGAEDTAAIQAAIDSLYPKPPPGKEPQGGGTVFLSPGRYDIASRLVFRSGITLEGVLNQSCVYATMPLAAMLQRPDLTPPPDGIHYNAATRVDGVQIRNLTFDGGSRDSEVGLDLTNTNYAVVENVSVIHCKTGILLGQLGMYNTFMNVAVGICDVGMEWNIGTMNNNMFGCRFGAVRTGMLINHTGQLNLYGTTFDSYKEVGVDVRGGDSVNLNNLWFDSVAPTTAIRIGPRVSQCTILNPRFSGPTPKELDIQAPDTVILDTVATHSVGLSLTRALAGGLRGTVSLSGADAVAPVRFTAPEADNSYFVAVTVTSAKGNPPVGARVVTVAEKSVDGFVIALQEPPGPDAVVVVEWIVVR